MRNKKEFHIFDTIVMDNKCLKISQSQPTGLFFAFRTFNELIDLLENNRSIDPEKVTERRKHYRLSQHIPDDEVLLSDESIEKIKDILKYVVYLTPTNPKYPDPYSDRFEIFLKEMVKELNCGGFLCDIIPLILEKCKEEVGDEKVKTFLKRINIALPRE